MSSFDIGFQKMTEIIAAESLTDGGDATQASARELDEIDELRRFSAELREPESISLTTT